MIIEFNC